MLRDVEEAVQSGSTPESRVWYVVGDNGDGQSTLSCIAHLLPRAMGFTQPSAEEEDLIRFLSPGRESLKEAAARVGITILDLEKLQT